MTARSACRHASGSFGTSRPVSLCLTMPRYAGTSDATTATPRRCIVHRLDRRLRAIELVIDQRRHADVPPVLRLAPVDEAGIGARGESREVDARRPVGEGVVGRNAKDLERYLAAEFRTQFPTHRLDQRQVPGVRWRAHVEDADRTRGVRRRNRPELGPDALVQGVWHHAHVRAELEHLASEHLGRDMDRVRLLDQADDDRAQRAELLPVGMVRPDGHQIVIQVVHEPDPVPRGNGRSGPGPARGPERRFAA